MDQLALPPTDSQNLLHLPIGAVSPLWAPFALAATAGAAWYWMTQWQRTNLEAFMALPMRGFDVAEAPAEAADPVAETLPEPVAQVVMAVMPEPVAPDPDGAIEAEFEEIDEVAEESGQEPQG